MSSSAATWYVRADGVDGDDGKTWADCTETGCDTNTLTLLPRASASGWRYRCRITGSGLTAVSDAALLTVTVPKMEKKPQVEEKKYISIEG